MFFLKLYCGNECKNKIFVIRDGYNKGSRTSSRQGYPDDYHHGHYDPYYYGYGDYYDNSYRERKF
jgi:hypothetical protein